jgi:hypothetical protein
MRPKASKSRFTRELKRKSIATFATAPSMACGSLRRKQQLTSEWKRLPASACTQEHTAQVFSGHAENAGLGQSRIGPHMYCKFPSESTSRVPLQPENELPGISGYKKNASTGSLPWVGFAAYNALSTPAQQSVCMSNLRYPTSVIADQPLNCEHRA